MDRAERMEGLLKILATDCEVVRVSIDSGELALAKGVTEKMSLMIAVELRRTD